MIRQKKEKNVIKYLKLGRKLSLFVGDLTSKLKYSKKN
jgi:hypothetical protein